MPGSNLQLGSESDYLAYFTENFCEQVIYTNDGIRIHFRKHHFYHAFFESDLSKKDTFSLARACRMPDILPILQSPSAEYRCGWDNKTRKFSASKRVAFLMDPFVVVVLLKRNKKTGQIQGEFITCYQANPRTFQLILQNPRWDVSMI